MSNANDETKQDKASQDEQKQTPLNPFEEMDRLFDSFLAQGAWPKSWMRPFHWQYPAWPENELPLAGRWPRVDIILHEKEVVIYAELPGVKKEELNISVERNMVTIRGICHHHEKELRGNYFRAEMKHGHFGRTVTLPCEVEGEKANAKLEDGVLTLTVPKQTREKSRSIPVE